MSFFILWSACGFVINLALTAFIDKTITIFSALMSLVFSCGFPLIILLGAFHVDWKAFWFTEIWNRKE